MLSPVFVFFYFCYTIAVFIREGSVLHLGKRLLIILVITTSFIYTFLFLDIIFNKLKEYLTFKNE